MILWTLQHPAVLDTLEANGRYVADPKNLAFPPEWDDAVNHTHAAYQWLIAKMKAHIGKPPEGVEYPSWAWYKQSGRSDGKPDMRQSGHGEPGTPLVRMKLDVSDSLVLLSDFGNWHHVLNYWYLSKTEEEDKIFEAEYKTRGISFHDLGNFDLDSSDLRTLRRKIEGSWDYVFDIRSPRDEYWQLPWQERSIQATFWTLERQYVLSDEHFIAR